MPKPQAKNSLKPAKVQAAKRASVWRRLWGALWHHGWWRRIVCIILALVMAWVGVMYGIAQWYIASRANEPMKWGATFIPDYAEFLGVDPQETFGAMINDLGLRQFRLVSYWDEGEAEQGVYNFDALDWQFKMAEESGSKVSLAIGLRQPRWPECHMPEWAAKEPMSVWAPQLKQYMKATIERYKNSPALESYQLENEFFLSVFGICPDFTRSRLVHEYNFAKSLDPKHPIIVSRSNNIIGIPINAPIPDESGVSVYKRVWDKDYSHRYIEYPFPAWFYATLAGGGKILNGKDMMIHELQTEPWMPEGFMINDVNAVDEMDKSLDAPRLAGRISYAKATGMKEAYFWGVEWWYWRKAVAHQPSVWDTAKQEIAKTKADNASKH